MLGNLTGWHLVIILAVVVLLFGAAKLPALAKALGQSARILKSEMRPGDKAEGAAEGAGVEGDAAHTSAAH
jgi:sec-independent protein translocase protein TatA